GILREWKQLVLKLKDLKVVLFRCVSGVVAETSCLFRLLLLRAFIVGVVIGGLFAIEGVCKESWFLSLIVGDKPPKNKGKASGFKGSNIDQYDPLFLHSNDTSGVPLNNFKLKGSKDQSTSNSFTDDQYKKLMALISEKSSSSSMPANIAGGSGISRGKRLAISMVIEAWLSEKEEV
ncbi:hypothetical protein Tco_1157600, partial [Tanacetum coccineum]